MLYIFVVFYELTYVLRNRENMIKICLLQQSSDREHLISTRAPDEEVTAFKI